MNDVVSSFPNDFRVLAGAPPAGFELSGRVVEPLLRIIKSADVFQAQLLGTRTVRGERRSWPAVSVRHNWVADGSVIRPLPHDSASAISEMLDGCDPDNLGFAEVIRLLRIEDPVVVVEAAAEVFLPAGDAAREMSASQEIQGLQATLFPYQAHGVAWMLQTIRHTGGLILADEMGLGKTLQIIALLVSDKPGDSEPALIVCPTSLIANWRSEILRFAPELSVMIHRGPHRTGVTSGLQRAQVVLSTYDTIVNDISIFSGMNWKWLICDEAQALKNPDSNRRKAISTIPRERTVPMTGTPVETSLLDLWSLTDLAIPGLLGSRESFEADYPNSEDAARNLAKLTDPVILCRKVRDVAGDLPDRIDIDVPLELGDELAERYDSILQETLEKYPVAGNLVATGQLQLFCAHPWLQGGGDADRDEEATVSRSSDMPLVTPKIERTLAILAEAFQSGRKVLIFAIFNRCDDLIRKAATRKLPNAFWGAINGSTPQEDRQAIVDEFSAHTGPACLVLNPKAAGAGLNITAATVVIHFTQAWNPALEAQASARAHRRGQSQPVHVYRLFYEDTVERVMIDRSQWRRELGNEAVPVSTRDADDLRRALSLRPETGAG